MDLQSYIMAFYVNLLYPSIKLWIFFVIAMVDWLSSNRVIECIGGFPRSKSSCLSHKHSWAVADRAMHFASDVDRVTQLCFLLFHVIGPPFSINR